MTIEKQLGVDENGEPFKAALRVVVKEAPQSFVPAAATLRRAIEAYLASAYDARPVAGDEQVERVRTAQKWAEGLISQLPDTHDGRNSWLLNYGASEEAEKIRAKWNREADQRHAPPNAKYRDLAALPTQGDGWQDIATLAATGLYLLASPTEPHNQADSDGYIFEIWAARAYHEALSPEATPAQRTLRPEAKKVTHWRPLPAPPAAKIERTKG